MAADLMLKFVLLGDSGIGKSHILIRYAEDAFTRTSISTIGIPAYCRAGTWSATTLAKIEQLCT